MVTGRTVVVLAALGACAAHSQRWPERRAGCRARVLADRRCREIGAASREDVRVHGWAARATHDD